MAGRFLDTVIPYPKLDTRLILATPEGKNTFMGTFSIWPCILVEIQLKWGVIVNLVQMTTWLTGMTLLQ